MKLSEATRQYQHALEAHRIHEDGGMNAKNCKRCGVPLEGREYGAGWWWHCSRECGWWRWLPKIESRKPRRSEAFHSPVGAS